MKRYLHISMVTLSVVAVGLYSVHVTKGSEFIKSIRMDHYLKIPEFLTTTIALVVVCYIVTFLVFLAWKKEFLAYMKYILILTIGILNAPFVDVYIKEEDGSLSMSYLFERMWPLVLISGIVIYLLFKYYSNRWIKTLSIAWIIIMVVFVYALAYV